MIGRSVRNVRKTVGCAMRAGQFRLLVIYLIGFGHVFLIAMGFSVIGVWLLQAGAMAFGESFDWGAIFVHLFVTASFVLLYPGQTFLTYRITDRRGQVYVIVGRDRDDSIGNR